MARRRRYHPLLLLLLALPLGLGLPSARAGDDGEAGYYRQPALHGDTIVFVSEGDLWSVSTGGGLARRLTTHADAELGPVISPDGETIAFTARYEGPREIYTMPLRGGRPTRLTFGAGYPWGQLYVSGYTADGRLLYATRRHATLPDMQLVLLDPATGTQERIPLAQADQGAFSADGASLYFTRLPFQGSNAKRYQGGSVQQLWRFRPGSDTEAVPLTADHPGTSKNPMVWNGRVYCLSDRDGTMNVWSFDGEGAERDYQKVTHQDFFDIRSASLHEGRLVYRVGADLHLVDLATGEDSRLDIRIVSDADHEREKWITKPMAFLTDARVSPDGSQVALTARGHVFVAPVGTGRLVDLPPHGTARNRTAGFSHDGTLVRYFSDRTDEVELWERPADGSGTPKQLTTGSTVLRTNHLPSPDGRFIAHTDLDKRLWILDTSSGKETRLEKKEASWLELGVWSRDSRWFTYTVYPSASLSHGVIRLHDTTAGTSIDVTNERYHSTNPAFSGDGKWLFFLSDRNFGSIAGSPWGMRQPEPHIDRPSQIFALSLQPGLRPLFQEPDELSRAAEAARKKEKTEKKEPAPEDDKKPGPAKKTNGSEGAEAKATDGGAPGGAPDEKKGDEKKETKDSGEKKPEPVEIDQENLSSRLYRLPVPAGRYDSLLATAGHLLWRSSADPFEQAKTGGRRWDLQALKLKAEKANVKTRLTDVGDISLSGDGSKLLVRKGNGLHVVGADADAPLDPKALSKGAVQLGGWRFSVDPRTEWEQMFHDAWRMHRDYFYDPGMHGVNWQKMRARYAPLVERVRNRAELEDLTGMLISELSALHASVGGGDRRKGQDNVDVGFLGGRFERDPAAGGYRLAYIYKHDPDMPEEASPLSRPDLDIQAGDVLIAINNQPALPSRELGEHLVNQVGRQVKLTFRREGREQDAHAILKPISGRAAGNLRYHEWRYTRRLETERLAGGKIGYVHLRGMGSRDMASFTRQFYPVFDRDGLILDVRHNGGGNIDAWILSRLIRKAWMHWQGRRGGTYPNMHYAPRGHMIVICDEKTASDGEAFSDGFRRLGLGPVLGTRTWGGEIWLSRSNRLSDSGVASAGMYGVFGPAEDGSDMVWLVEGRGVVPDIVVDNLPHETFQGRDRQLERAIEVLQEKIRTDPPPRPRPPAYPDKSAPNNR